MKQYNSSLNVSKSRLKRSAIKRKPGKRKKPPPTDLKKYDRILNPLCWEIAFLRAGGKCEKCGRRDRKLDMHHLFGKRLSMRWEPEGMAMLCFSPCHKDGPLNNPSAHQNLEAMRQFIRKKRGEDWYDRMVFQSRQTKNISDFNIGLEEAGLLSCIIRLKNERT